MAFPLQSLCPRQSWHSYLDVHQRQHKRAADLSAWKGICHPRCSGDDVFFEPPNVPSTFCYFPAVSLSEMLTARTCRSSRFVFLSSQHQSCFIQYPYAWLLKKNHLCKVCDITNMSSEETGQFKVCTKTK